MRAIKYVCGNNRSKSNRDSEGGQGTHPRWNWIAFDHPNLSNMSTSTLLGKQQQQRRLESILMCSSRCRRRR